MKTKDRAGQSLRLTQVTNGQVQLLIIPKYKCTLKYNHLTCPTTGGNEAMIMDRARTWCALIGKPARVYMTNI